MRLRPAAFWQLTWREYCAVAAGWHRRQIRKWHHTRYLATMLLNVNRAEKTPAILPHEVLWLPGDPEPTPPMDEVEFDATMARLAATD
ncbi:hypothetical protein ACVWYF_004144 [Hymenobacter sp. UYAg731]